MKRLLALMTILVCLNCFAEEPAPAGATSGTGENIEGCPKDCKCYPDGTLRPGKSNDEVTDWCKTHADHPSCKDTSGGEGGATKKK